MNTCKKIGIIGGVGPQATEMLYHNIMRISQKKYQAQNNDDFPRVVIDSNPIPDFISDTKKQTESKQLLMQTVQDMTNINCTLLCIASNTVHVLLKDLKKETNVPFLSIIDIVSEECSKREYKKVGLVGSPTLINSKLYQNDLNKNGIVVIIPTITQLVVIEKIIRSVLSGKRLYKEKLEYVEILHTLYDQGAESIILGCTELPLAINYEALSNKTINSEALLAEKLVDYYYAK